jgi:CDP-diglyceride synthetase
MINMVRTIRVNPHMKKVNKDSAIAGFVLTLIFLVIISGLISVSINNDWFKFLGLVVILIAVVNVYGKYTKMINR